MPSILHLEATHKGYLFEKFQINFDVEGIPAALNKFDPEQVDVSINFSGPDGRIIKINAFWAIDFCINDSSPDPTHFIPGYCAADNWGIADPEYLKAVETSTPWHVRFAPSITGKWRFDFEVKLGAFHYRFAGSSFQVADSKNQGFIKTAGRNFAFQRNGGLFYPIGINGVIHGSNRYNRFNVLVVFYAIDNIAKNGGNLCRLFITPLFFGIEWLEDGLTNFTSRQNRAFDLDRIIEYAHFRGVYLQLCIESYTEFNAPISVSPKEMWSSWSTNPYRHPVHSVLDFFTDAIKIHTYKKKLRYILARWGYSTNIFAFELFNEIDKVSAINWGRPGDIINWTKTIIAYCKATLGDKHLYTQSFATPDNAPKGNFVIDANLDFYTDHFYTYSKNQDHQINYLANRAKYLFGSKPYLLGETGLDRPLEKTIIDKPAECKVAPYTNSFLNTPEHTFWVYQLHDALWASVLSGSSGTALFWEISLFDKCRYGYQFSYMLPLVKFLQGEDLNLNSFKAITNKCDGSDYRRDTSDPRSHCGPGRSVLHSYIPESQLNESIVTNDDKNVEVFALQYHTGDKILGWVKNTNNWWFNLPHNEENQINSPCYNPRPSIGAIPVLDFVVMTISGLKCDAIYNIDFYSTYPKYPTNSSVPVDGGRIDAFSVRAASRCGILSFKVPKLQVLQPGIAAYAPDYAFKITIHQKLWGHWLIGPQPVAQPFAISGDGTQIAYRGGDGRLNCFYMGAGRGGSSWGNAILTPGGTRSVKVNGAIARGHLSNQIYYHGSDNVLQCAYWGGSGWLHTHFTDWSGRQNVAGDIVSNAVGGKVFYRGVDGKLHHYYWDGSGWRHQIIFLWTIDLIAADSNLAVNADGSIVVYKNTSGKLHIMYKSSGVWYHDTSALDVVLGTIRMNNAGDVIFYRGLSGRLYQYYYYGSGWHSRLIVTSAGVPVYIDGTFDITPDCTYNNAQVYFRGPDGHMNVVYASGGTWIQDYLICPSFLNATEMCKKGGYIRYANGMVAYDAESHYMEVYVFNTCGNATVYGPRH